jgi:hypothetical protein
VVDHLSCLTWSLQVFVDCTPVVVFYHLFIYVLPLEIQLLRGRGGDLLTGLTLPHFCSCFQARTSVTDVICHGSGPHTITKMNDNINMDSTVAGSMNDNINMDSTVAGSMNYYNLSVQFIGGTSPCGGSFVCLHATKLY